jgi:hypothetical protein
VRGDQVFTIVTTFHKTSGAKEKKFGIKGVDLPS